MLDWTAGPFLTLYVALYVACLVAGGMIARAQRPAGTPGSVTDPVDAAVLGKGRERLGEVVVARLIERGALKVEKGKLVPQPGARGENHIESTVLGLAPPISWSRIRKVTDMAVGEVEKRLERRGLLQERGEAAQRALVACLPLFGLLLVGLAKALVGSSRGHPVGFLIMLMLVTLVTILVRLAGAPRITGAGREALRRATDDNARLKLAPGNGEASMAVALFGTGVLVGSSMGDFHRLRTSGGDGGGDGGDSSGDGGSGCGGGGCGGCGG